MGTTVAPDATESRTGLPALATAAADSVAHAATLAGFGLDPAITLGWIRAIGARAARPGVDTAQRWRLLAEVACLDVGAARMLEPHLDALAILAEAHAGGVLTHDEPADATWGVFAAEGGAAPLRADRDRDGVWRLTGTKPWCSLAAHLDRALVMAWIGEDRGLFAVDLRAAGVRPHPGPWTARGLPQVVSAPVDFDGVVASPVGGPGWYLRRAGFAWGGMGVAAVWWGAALPLVDALAGRAARPDADQLALTYAGSADAASWSASAVLAAAARAVDHGIEGGAAKLLAARVRAVVASGTREVLSLESRALGPGPVASDDAHGRRVADLELYLRQDHAERDLARLGRLRSTTPEESR